MTQAILVDLKQHLTTGNLTGELRAAVQFLIERLETPVRVVVLGPIDSGRSSLIKLLVGGQDIQGLENASAATVFHPRTRVVIPDALKNEIIRIPLEAIPLRHMQVTKVTTGTGQVSVDETIHWAANHADIAICCMPEADAEFLQGWSRVNDTLKDNSLLLLSKADVLQRQGTMQATLNRLEELASESFIGVFPIAAPQALLAVRADGTKNLPLWKGSGGADFVAALAKLVRLGQGGDIDQAEAFLKRYPAPIRQEQSTIALSDQSDSIFVEALEFLQIRAGEMLAALRSEPETDIVGACLETAANLTDILTGSDIQTPVLDGLRADAEEATDMMVLFQLEKSTQAKADAVTMLLQLKQEIHIQTAA